LKGIVKRWLDGKGYGFIESDEGVEAIFVHHSDLIRGLYELKEGQRVDFEVQKTDRGQRAIDVKPTK